MEIAAPLAEVSYSLLYLCITFQVKVSLNILCSISLDGDSGTLDEGKLFIHCSLCGSILGNGHTALSSSLGSYHGGTTLVFMVSLTFIRFFYLGGDIGTSDEGKLFITLYVALSHQISLTLLCFIDLGGDSGTFDRGKLFIALPGYHFWSEGITQYFMFYLS